VSAIGLGANVDGINGELAMGLKVVERLNVAYFDGLSEH
jgi:hypothetical protein